LSLQGPAILNQRVIEFYYLVDISILDDFGGVCDGSKEEVMLGHTLL
jgi:hypothetical protein